MLSQDFEAAQKVDYCMTSGCVKAASDILQNMDESIDPCDDFYQFACGGFIKKTVIPDDRTRMSSFSVLSDELLSQVRMLLEEDSPIGTFINHVDKKVHALLIWIQF